MKIYSRVLQNLFQDFQVTVTDEFLEFVDEDALSIEVWGHRTNSAFSTMKFEEETMQKSKSLQER